MKSSIADTVHAAADGKVNSQDYQERQGLIRELAALNLGVNGLETMSLEELQDLLLLAEEEADARNSETPSGSDLDQAANPSEDAHLEGGKNFDDSAKASIDNDTADGGKMSSLDAQKQRLQAIFEGAAQLEKIRDYARGTQIGPMACLIMSMHEVLSYVDPSVQLDAGMGPGSLNLFSCLVGPSGAAKSLSQKVGRSAVKVVNNGWMTRQIMGTGSGEGIVMALKPDAETGSAASGLLIESEVTNMGVLMERSGSTWRQMVTKAFTGELIAINNKHEQICIEDGTYRFNMSIGVQPEHSDVILAHDAQGFPQRFVWVGVTDPLREAGKAYEKVDPAIVDLEQYKGDCIIYGCDEQRRILQEHVDRRLIYGDTDGLNGHAFFVRSKIAAALAIIRQHDKVTSDDWYRAGLIMEESDYQRGLCEKAYNEKRVIADAKRREDESRAGDIAHKNDFIRYANKFLAPISDGKIVTRRSVRHKLNSRYRQTADEAFEELVESGLIRMVDDRRYTQGERYRPRY